MILKLTPFYADPLFYIGLAVLPIAIYIVSMLMGFYYAIIAKITNKRINIKRAFSAPTEMANPDTLEILVEKLKDDFNFISAPIRNIILSETNRDKVKSIISAITKDKTLDKITKLKILKL
jgi:predicted regulator of amino acid metabolism with ACT domain